MIKKDYQTPITEEIKQKLRELPQQLKEQKAASYIVFSFPKHLKILIGSMLTYLEVNEELLKSYEAQEQLRESELNEKIKASEMFKEDITEMLNMIHDMLNTNKQVFPETTKGLAITVGMIPIPGDLIKEAANKPHATVVFTTEPKGEA